MEFYKSVEELDKKTFRNSHW